MIQVVQLACISQLLVSVKQLLYLLLGGDKATFVVFNLLIKIRLLSILTYDTMNLEIWWLRNALRNTVRRILSAFITLFLLVIAISVISQISIRTEKDSYQVLQHDYIQSFPCIVLAVWHITQNKFYDYDLIQNLMYVHSNTLFMNKVLFLCVLWVYHSKKKDKGSRFTIVSKIIFIENIGINKW